MPLSAMYASYAAASIKPFSSLAFVNRALMSHAAPCGSVLSFSGVLCSSAFASNQFVEMLGNRDLAVSLVNELAGDEMLIASRERLNKSETAAFYISDQEARHLLVLSSIVEPAILFLIAMTVFMRRRFFT